MTRRPLITLANLSLAIQRDSNVTFQELSARTTKAKLIIFVNIFVVLGIVIVFFCLNKFSNIC